MKIIVQLLRRTLLLLLLIGSVPIASGQNRFLHQGIEYEVTSPTTVAVVQAWTGNYSGDVVIPSEVTVHISVYNEEIGHTFIVTSVDESAFSYCGNLTSIVLPNTIKTIGRYAFYGCTQLSSVTLSTGLETIGSYAFAHCSSLHSIELPYSVHSLSWNAFYYCTSLSSVTLPDNIWELNGTFVGCSNLSSINIPSNLVSIDGAFTDCSSLASLVIPSSVTYIGEKSFQNCSSLSSVYIPNSVSQIGNYAFNNTGLTTVSIPNTVTHIGENTFQGCNKLVSITSRPVTPPALAKSNTFSQWIYNNAQLVVPQVALYTYKSTDWWNLFKNVTGDQSLNNSYDFVVNGIYYIKLDDTTVEVTYKDTNYNSYSSNVTVPATVAYGGKTYNVTRIGFNAFYHCSGLTGISLPASVTSISAGAFNGCTGLTSLTIPQNIKSIGAGAFSGCTGLTQLVWNATNCLSNGDMTTSNINKVTIGDNVVVLPIGFVANAKITSANLPNSISLIGGHAFESCKSMSSLTIPVDVSCIGDSAFAQCSGLTHLTWNARECWFNGNMYTNNLTAVAIGNNVRVLPEGLADNSKITAITIPSSVERIGGYAFRSCNLGEINFPSGLKSIGAYAFYHCTGIQSLTIPSNVEIIDEYAFDGCSGITQLTWKAKDCVSNGDMTTGNITKATIGNEVKTIPNHFVSGSKITSITIPSSVTSIGSSAFCFCTGLTTVTIPDAVTTIGSEAFYGCTGVYSVTIGASVKNIGSHAFENCSSLTSVTIGASVENIGYRAFENCSSLTKVLSLPLTPPTIDYYTFYGVPSSMTVYVLPAALGDYQSNYYWNKFTIEPANFDVSNLTIHLPNGIDIAKYANMKLEIAQKESDQILHYIINDKPSYTFANLNKNTVWDVVLTNQYGDEFGKIEDVEIGEEDVIVTFPSLKEPQTVTLKVKTPNGQDVTAQTKITWKDENGELLVQSNQIAGLPAGRKLAYSVTLPQELATAYALPSDMGYTVKDGDNTIVCQLTAIAQAKLSGKVKEATSNQPIYGAHISATQSFAGGNSNTLTTTTDNQGLYTLDALSVPTTLTVAAQGYISQTLDCDELKTGGNNITLPDVVLQPITGAVVNVNLSYTPAHAVGGTAETQNWYNDYNNVDYEVYNKTKGHAITNISVQYPQIVLLEDVNDGDVLELSATSRKDAFMPVKTTVTIAEQRATATFNILEWGQVMAKFMKNINPKVRGSLYDAENKFIMGADYSGSTLTIDNLPDGSYKLITMGKSDFFNSIYDLDQFGNAGLNEGEDYVKHNVQVESGIVSEVTIDEVPFFDESKFYYTKSPTSFTVNKPNIVVGNYLTFRAQVDFKEQYADKVSDVQLIIDLPESCSFIENSVLVGASSSGYIPQGNRITIPMSMAENANVVRFCAIPIEAGNFAPSAFVKFKLNGKTITQPIGNAKFNAKGLSINLVSHTADTTIQVNGTAYKGQSVKIYDGNVLIGQTQCRADGYWSASVDLYKPYSHPYHHIQADIEINNSSRQGLTLKTESKMVEYDKNAIFVSKVTQYNEQRGPRPYLITLDFFDPNQPSQHYSYDMYDNHRTFTYTIDFSDNSAVSNVMLYVRTALNHWWPLAATYNAQKDLWVTAGEFGNAQDADLPVNVAVGYDYEHKTDDEDINDAMLEDFANCFDNMISEIDAAYMNADCEMISESDDCYVFSVSPNGYDTQEYYELQILDYDQTVQQYQQRNQDNDYYTIKNDTTDIGFALNFNEDSTYTTIIWDNIEQMAFQLGLLNSYIFNRNLGPKRNPVTVGIGVVANIGFGIWEYHKRMEIIDNYYQDVEEEMQLMEVFQSELFDRLNALCEDGKLKIQDQEKYYDALDLIYQWRGEHENFISDLLYLIYLEQQDLLTKCIAKSAVGILTSLAGGLLGEELNCAISKIGGVLAENLVHGVTEGSMSAISYIIGKDVIDPAIDDNQKTRTSIDQYWIDKGGYLRDLRSEIRQFISDSYSDCKDEPDDYWGDPYPGPDMTFCIDPSGFVYEGVPSNRLEGVTATCYYKETVEDMYGDLHEEVVLWDAENYGQENPLLTDQNGYYRWDVPIGMWQVKYEKAGYETTYSDWLPVPPPQLDVNIGMVQMRQPEVIKARAYNKAVEFEFDKYMLPEDLTTDNITVLNDYGNAVTGTIELLNAEVDDPNAITSIRRAPGTGLTLASKVRFNSNSRFYQYATLKVSKRVKSYAGLEMNEDYVITLPVEYEMEKIVVDSTLNLLYGDSRQLTVTVEPAMASRGKTLNVRTMSPMILSTDAESYTLDNNGQAVVTVHGDLPGMGSLLYDIDGYDLSAATLVNVMMESDMTVATPTATIASGSEVEKGTAVYLRCSTEGATIYYTLDGSCPCDNTPARKVYDGSPIIIDRTMTIKAMATAPDLYDSDVATFVYRINNGLRGDVNGDGEVNIADVNAVIGVILGIRTDEDIISRADVNSDGEVNIADVNEIIRIILGTSNGVKLNVNCDDALHLNDIQLRPGEVKTLNVTLDNAMRYSALQCDIVLPAGLTLVDVNTTNGSVSKSGMTSDTTTRVMIYSMSKRQFTGNGSGVLTMTVRADDSLPSDSKITLTHVVLADNQDKAWHSADCTASVNNTSGINDLTAGNDRVWVEGRTLCIRTQQDGIARLTTINGIVHELDVKSGVTRHMLDAGIYVVVLNGNSYKIAVK